MKTNKKITFPSSVMRVGFFIAILLIGVAVIYGLGKRGKNQSGNVTLPMTVKNRTEETKLFSIKVAYPVFGNTLDQLNAAVEKEVSSRIDEFKAQSTANWEETKLFRSSGGAASEYPESPFTFLLSWTPQQVNANYISFVLTIEWYTGGANVSQDFLTFNWDVKKNIPIILKDLFIGKPDYLETVAAYARKSLKDQFISNGTPEEQIQMDMLEEGTAPKEENYKRFTFTDTTITFYFPKYQVAAGAFGPQTVVMSRTRE